MTGVQGDRRAGRAMSWRAWLGLWAGAAALIAMALHLLAYAPLAVQNIDLSASASDEGRAYIAQAPRSWLLSGAGARLRLMEDGRPMGPANSLHTTIRRMGEGRYSVWGDVVYFSASDQTDPRVNGRSYQLQVPWTPGPVGAALLGLLLAAGGVVGAVRIRHRLSFGAVSPWALAGFVAFVLLSMTLKPWNALFVTTGTGADAWRVGVTAALALAFVPVRARELPRHLRLLLGFSAVIFVVGCALRWYPLLPQAGGALDAWLVQGNRWLGVLAACVSYRRPSLLVYAVGSSQWARQAHERMAGFPQADVDEAPIADMVLFLCLWCMCVAVAYRRRRLAGPRASAVWDLGFYAALGIHFANYFHSALAKLGLDGPIGSWIVANPTYALLANAQSLGVSPIGAYPSAFSVVDAVFREQLIAFNSLTFVPQLLSLPAILAGPYAAVLTLVFDAWHLGVFVTTGIFFWKWILLNAGFVAAFRLAPRSPTLLARMAGCVLCIIAPSAFHTFPAGWYDSFHLNRLSVYAETLDGTSVRVPPAFFLHYSFGAVADVFWAPGVTQSLYPTGTYGTTFRYGDAMESSACAPRTAAAAMPGPAVNPRIGTLVQALHADALAHADPHSGAPAAWRYWLYPFHIVTNLPAFTGFWGVDLRSVQSYRFDIDMVCTVGAQAVLSGPFLRSSIHVRTP